MTMQDLIKLFLFIAILVLFYQCIRKGRRRHIQQHANGGFASQREEDLQRFRQRMSERGGSVRNNANSASAIAARKELIEKNLFSREIRREESVRELKQLLAISRGGEVDEELGGCSPADVKKPKAVASEAESSMPAPSAPPSSEREAARAAPQAQPVSPLHLPPEQPVDTIAVAIEPNTPPTFSAVGAGESSREINEAPQNQPAANPVSLEPVLDPIRNLWNNITHGTERRASERRASHSNVAAEETTCAETHSHKLECSICLEEYSAGDIVAWAKDGGDASADAAAISSERGCVHIFHKGCISAWLEENDDCPLCRRKVVHEDADVRWDAIVDGPAATKEDYAPVVLVTAAAIILYYIFLFNQSRTTFVEFNAAKKANLAKKTDAKPSITEIKYGGDNARVRAANRAAGNFGEQLPPFFVGLYLYATYVSVGGAAKLGWLWILFRSYYMPAFERGPEMLSGG